MGMRRIGLLMAILGLVSGCVATGTPPAGGVPQALGERSPAQAAQSFAEVVARVEPVAERECRQRQPRGNCDFLIQVNVDTRAPANAFQSLGEDGRPVLTFNIALIALVENDDELAFVVSHEAAHHVAGHLARQAENAAAGAAVFSGLASATGATPAQIEEAERLGAFVGVRSYSRDFELEADQLGTIIASRAGYNPIVGAAYFQRIPDPGDRFLGTHPPNADRIEVVRQTAAQLGLS